MALKRRYLAIIEPIGKIVSRPGNGGRLLSGRPTQLKAGNSFPRGRYLRGEGRGDPPKCTAGTAGCGGSRRGVAMTGYGAPWNLGGAPGSPWGPTGIGGRGHQKAPRGDGEVENRKRPSPSQVTESRVAMYGNAAICVICLANRTRQKKRRGSNLCVQPRRHTYLARYMRGRKKKSV